MRRFFQLKEFVFIFLIGLLPLLICQGVLNARKGTSLRTVEIEVLLLRYITENTSVEMLTLTNAWNESARVGLSEKLTILARRKNSQTSIGITPSYQKWKWFIKE